MKNSPNSLRFLINIKKIKIIKIILFNHNKDEEEKNFLRLRIHGYL